SRRGILRAGSLRRPAVELLTRGTQWNFSSHELRRAFKVNPLSKIALAAGLMAPGLAGAAARADGTAAPPPTPPAAGQPNGAGKAAGTSAPAEDPRDRKIRELEQLV